LKIIQEIITLLVFTGFAAAWLRETQHWNTVVAFFLIVSATGFAFLPHHT
jgi:hypothetical protein